MERPCQDPHLCLLRFVHLQQTRQALFLRPARHRAMKTRNLGAPSERRRLVPSASQMLHHGQGVPRQVLWNHHMHLPMIPQPTIHIPTSLHPTHPWQAPPTHQLTPLDLKMQQVARATEATWIIRRANTGWTTVLQDTPHFTARQEVRTNLPLAARPHHPMADLHLVAVKLFRPQAQSIHHCMEV